MGRVGRDLLLKMILRRIRRRHLVQGSTGCQRCSRTCIRDEKRLEIRLGKTSLFPRPKPCNGGPLEYGDVSPFHDSSTMNAPLPTYQCTASGLSTCYTLYPTLLSSTLRTLLNDPTISSKTHLWFLILDNLLDLFPFCIPNTHQIPILPFPKLVDSI
jgi:hypothetical protein